MAPMTMLQDTMPAGQTADQGIDSPSKEWAPTCGPSIHAKSVSALRGASRDTGHQEGAWGSIKPAQATNGFGFTDSAATGSPASVHQAPRYQCLSPGCKNTRGFERFRDLERHRDTVHKKSRSTVCEACGKQLSRGDKLAEHRRKFHDHAPVEYTFVEQAPSA